jgi:hypothetical protein
MKNVSGVYNHTLVTVTREKRHVNGVPIQIGEVYHLTIDGYGNTRRGVIELWDLDEFRELLIALQNVAPLVKML